MSSVLIDLNNLSVRCLFSKETIQSDNTIDWELWKYRIFTSIYSSLFQIKDANEIILAVDSEKSWRKLYFPRYKESRSSQRQKVDIDWSKYFSQYESLQEDIANHLPFKVLKVKFAEGDDIIGTLCLNYNERIFHIISTDADFVQLLSKNVHLYNPLKKKYVEHPQPHTYLQESILMGQPKDGILNVRTPTDWPNQLRKPPLGKKKTEQAFIKGLDLYLDDVIKYRKSIQDDEGNYHTYVSSADLRERYKQNQILIDLSKVPSTIQNKILYQYQNYKLPDPINIYYFFKDKGWPEYLDENFNNVERNLLNLY